MPRDRARLGRVESRFSLSSGSSRLLTDDYIRGEAREAHSVHSTRSTITFGISNDSADGPDTRLGNCCNICRPLQILRSTPAGSQALEVIPFLQNECEARPAARMVHQYLNTAFACTKWTVRAGPVSSMKRPPSKSEYTNRKLRLRFRFQSNATSACVPT